MKEFNVKESRIETATARGSLYPISTAETYPAYIGLDVHKDTIAVAAARMGREEPQFYRYTGFSFVDPFGMRLKQGEDFFCVGDLFPLQDTPIYWLHLTLGMADKVLYL